MKFIVFTVLAFLSSQGYSQNKTYPTFKISKWSLEYFPVHYVVKPHHVVTQAKFGKIATYKEVDEYGNTDGIFVTMQQNLVYPHSISYWYKGEMVYNSTYFNNSNKANYIRNRSDKGILDGPEIFRTIKPDNSVEVRKIIYKDGKEIASKEPVNVFEFNEQGLLSGEIFVKRYNSKYVSSENYTLQGNAIDGEIQFVEIQYQNGNLESYKLDGDCLVRKYYSNQDKDTLTTFSRIRRRIKVTNSINSDKVDSLFFISKGVVLSYDQSGLTNSFYRLFKNVTELRIDQNYAAKIPDSIECFVFKDNPANGRYRIENNLLSGKFSSKYFSNYNIEGFAEFGVIQEVCFFYLCKNFSVKFVKNVNKYFVYKIEPNKDDQLIGNYNIIDKRELLGRERDLIVKSSQMYDTDHIVAMMEYEGFDVLSFLLNQIESSGELRIFFSDILLK